MSDGLPRELIRASAGTGKTFQISNRIVGLLAEEVEPASILASTFTRKAAGEILSRVLLRLSEAALDPDAAEELAEHALLESTSRDGLDDADAERILGRLARRMHRIDVGTLDALFVRMARTYGPELGLPPGWSIADDLERERLCSDAVQAVLGAHEPGALAELLRLSTRGRSGRRVHDRLTDEVDTLHQYHQQRSPGTEDAWAPFRERDRSDDPEATRRDLAERLEDVDVPTNKDESPNKGWVSALEKAVSALRDGDWEMFWGKGPPKKFLAGETDYNRKPFPDGLDDLLDEVRDQAAAELTATYGAQVEALGRIARRYHEALREEQRRAGAYRFEDIAHFLGQPDPIGGRPDFDHRMNRRAEHVLLDEFQDTSVAQWEALRPLVDEILEEGERSASALVVADPKQSIYGWRGADPEVVERAERHYDLAADGLHHSWRSSPIVLDFVNQVFGGIEANPVIGAIGGGAGIAADWGAAFEEHVPAPDLEGRPGRVTVEIGPDDGGRGAERPRLMARAAERVSEIRDAAPGAEIGVLVRRNDTVARLIHELRVRGIDASEEGKTAVDDAAPVAAVLALLQLADHPGDRIARYHVASSPLGETLGYGDHRDDAEARELAATVRADLLRDGYGPTLSRWIEDLGGEVSPREIRRLEQLVELGFRWEERAALRPADFARFVRSESVQDPLSTAVRVMTVHQAKGLEFDVVVLPELDDSISTGRVETALPERDPETGLVRRIFPAVRKGLRPLFPEMEKALAQHRTASIRDELSWLYVGMTRAKHALHLLMAADDGSSNAKSFARLVRAAVGHHEEPVPDGTQLCAEGDPEWYRRVEGMEHEPERPETEAVDLRVDPDAPRTRVLPRTSPSDLEAGGYADPDDVLRLDRADALRRGDLLHDWCRRIGWIEDGLPGDRELREAARTLAPGVDEEEVGRLSDRFRTWMEEPSIVDVLSREAVAARLHGEEADEESSLDLSRERRFAHRRGGEVVSGVIDRLVIARDEDGRTRRAEVVDFKTDRLESDDREALAERVESYRPQVEAYRDIVAAIYGIDEGRVTARLAFVVPGVVSVL